LPNALGGSDKIKSANRGALRTTKQQIVSLEVPFAISAGSHSKHSSLENQAALGV
jgi:hypothetical protein